MITANRPSDGNPSRIREEFVASGDALAALAERTAEVDRLILEAASTLLFPAVRAETAVLAVGGYGRRQLFPYSDIDVLLLFPSERQALESKSAISAFLQHLWDAGLRMSHSVRTPAECCEVHDQNTELNVSLLDQRFLTGDRALYAGLADRLPRFVHANRDALVRNLARLTRERHAKHGGTFYHLEPNVKDTPGGLRDYQLICWLDQLRNGGADPSTELREAYRFLARLRCYLHYQSNRDNNLLSFDAQDSLAAHWHLEDTAQWMREYFRHSRATYRAAIRALEAGEALSTSLFSQLRDFRSRVSNAEFSVNRERLNFREPQRLEVEPELALRLFEFVGRHGIRLSYETEQRLTARLPRLRDHFATPQALWPTLNGILSLPHAPMAARALHETGILSAIFPEFEQIECLVVRDFYHRYTVDEHTLVTLDELWGLRAAEEGPLRNFRDLLAEIKEPGFLALALLFHDVGKGTPGEGHVTASARLAAAAMGRIQMPAQDRQMVHFLIARHLELSAAMQSRDVFDPQTIRDVAHQVATVERLKALTLLTYADISAVFPGCMTPWRAEQLWRLYLRVYHELTRELQTERIDTIPSGPPERIAFLQGFPTRYLRTHSDSEIDEHVALEAGGRARGMAVDIRRLDAAWQLTLIAHDRPGLFASVAGTLSCFGMNILKAEAFSNRRSLVLDTFTFADSSRTLDLNPSEVDRLRATVERVLSGKADVRELLRNRPKPALPSRKARIPASVSFDSEASGAATLIEIVAEDRPGLLYDLANSITANGGNIEVVLIDTQAHKAIDVFYVTADGVKLSAGKQQAMGEALRQACQQGSSDQNSK
jgi:[protein-PII] uridylyltransferase